MIKKLLGALLFCLSLFGLPESFVRLFALINFIFAHETIRTLICVFALFLLVGEKLVNLIPFLRRLNCRITIWCWGLKPVYKIAKDKKYQPEPDRVHVKDSFRETINFSWAAIEILSLIRAGLLPAWFYDSTSGHLEIATPDLIQELFRSEKFRHGQIPNVLVSEGKVKGAMDKFLTMGKLAV